MPIDLGDFDAATETPQVFRNHFVESLDLARINTPHSDIIYGSKGVGKTALRRALTEINRDSFFATKTIDLDQVSFTQVHAALSNLRKIANTEVARLARNTWLNVLAMYCLETVADRMEADLRREIRTLLGIEQFTGHSSNDRLVGQIERLFGLVEDLSFEDGKSRSLGLSPRQLSVLNEFPPTYNAVGSLLLNCAKIVADSGKAVVLCLDGFDTIVEHTAESRKAIFAGLIAAVHQYAKDPELCDAFCFKAFLPQELAEGAFVWDEDKFARHTHYLSWSEADFQEFLKRRLSPYAKTKSNRFLDVWHEFMPDKIHNDTHGTDEISFNYILRHTLYRPRQLLMHLQEIFDRWSENSNVARVDPSFIPRIVARTNYNLAKGVVDRLELAHPRLSVFMQSLRSAPSIMRTGEFQGRMKNIFKLEGAQDVADAFNVLFNFGIFGTAKESDMPKPGQEVRFGFGFIGDRIANVAASVDDRDYVALSPMFREYCGCTAAQWGPVIPVSTWIG